ncbi:hypothetical protein AB1K42_18050 [Roseibium algicola]|uniref:hypothetical protein n=1 Tax=Roseibium algicola TaxID=2857014 RepID=UPI0034595A33
MGDSLSKESRRIFFSYTKDLADEAYYFHSNFKDQLGADIEHVDDWLITPQMVGSLWDGLHGKIESCDVFVALICKRYGESIGGKEADYLRKVWGTKRRLFVPILFCPEASNWWSEFLEDAATPQEFRNIVWHKLHDGTQRKKFFMVDEDQDRAMLRPNVRNFINRLSQNIGSVFKEWESDTGGETPPPGRDKPSVYVFGGMEWKLSEKTAKARDDLVAKLEDSVGEMIVNVGDEWGKALVRAKNKALFEKGKSSVAHVIAIGDERLRKDFLAEDKEAGEKIILDEIYQNIGEPGATVAQVAKRYLWMPSYNEEESAAINSGARFEYRGGSANTMANSILGLVGCDREVEILLEHSGKFQRVQHFAKSELPPNLEIEANSEVFTGAPAMKSLLKSGSPTGKRLTIVAIGDKAVRAHTSDSRELNKLFRIHLRQYENQIDELEIDNDEQRIFRVFLQYQHTKEASAQHDVNGRVWEVLRFEDPRRGKPCPNSLSDLCETFKNWYSENWDTVDNPELIAPRA